MSQPLFNASNYNSQIRQITYENIQTIIRADLPVEFIGF